MCVRVCVCVCSLPLAFTLVWVSCCHSDTVLGKVDYFIFYFLPFVRLSNRMEVLLPDDFVLLILLMADILVAYNEVP